MKKLFINGDWKQGKSEETLPILNPSTEQELSRLSVASAEDLDLALTAAERGLSEWKSVAPWEKGAILFKAAHLLRGRIEEIARSITLEQGKPLAESMAEVGRAADFLEWGGAEARRLHGRIHTGRDPSNVFRVEREPIGVVAAFTPWNFPIVQMAKKIAAILAAGCSFVAKPAEETPSSCIALIEVLLDAGVPPLAMQLVFGHPSEISSQLIASPIVRKVTFTGSVPVGKMLAAMAGQHMKPATMELGGHAATIVFEDADIVGAANMLANRKFVNAGQVCVSPTRFFVAESICDEFTDCFLKATSQLQVGDGLEPTTTMGPLANRRRLEAIDSMVTDALANGAEVLAGGMRHGNVGNFYHPTILKNVGPNTKMMQDEPFGPVAPINTFTNETDIAAKANSLPFGLSAYFFTKDSDRMERMISALKVGVVGVNDAPFHLPETPFGGTKDSGYGTEGGLEMLDSYLSTKLVSIR